MGDNYKAAVRLFPIVAGSGVLVLPVTEKLLATNPEMRFLAGAIGVGIVASIITYLFAAVSDKDIQIETEDP